MIRNLIVQFMLVPGGIWIISSIFTGSSCHVHPSYYIIIVFFRSHVEDMKHQEKLRAQMRQLHGAGNYAEAEKIRKRLEPTQPKR